MTADPEAVGLYDWKRCSHEGIGLPGCITCDPSKERVALRAAFVARRGMFARAGVLAFGERVREACAKVVDGCAVDESPSAPNYLDDVADMLRAVDVARLLEEDK